MGIRKNLEYSVTTKICADEKSSWSAAEPEEDFEEDHHSLKTPYLVMQSSERIGRNRFKIATTSKY